MEAVTQAAPRPINPWTAIWTRPRATVRYLVQQGHGPMVFVLAALGGVSQLLDRAAMMSLGDTIPAGTIVLLAVLLGPAFGIIGLYIAGELIAWTGGWIGGRSSGREIRIALAWATVPIVFGLLLWVFNLAVFGGDLFTTYMPRVEAAPILGLVMMASGLVAVILGIWSFVIMLKGIGEVQGFSAWKALGNLVLALLPIVALGMAVAILLPAAA